jgi:hypothetical protein
MRTLSFVFSFLLVGLSAMAHEGMWLPQLVKRLNHADMQKMGLQLTADEIYSINNASLKDAIISMGGFCTAEVISDQGLMLTNHHCGYDAIQSHSSVEKDYLKDGFWAMSRDQELPNPGLTAVFLVRIEDVTDSIMSQLDPNATEADRAKKADELGKAMAKRATKDTHYTGYVRSFLHGNEYYLFVVETFKDVRLVGAPPSSVGKFGGDTDNWMWPRHTGDFSIFRIYAGEDNKPAEYSADNKPFKPRHHLPVSLEGIKDGDFTMIMGYPGRTDRYLSARGVQQAVEKYNPTIVKIRDKKLEIMRGYMDSDPALRIQFASNYASTANYWKYYIGATEQLKRNRVYDQKRALEAQFADWVKADGARQQEYGSVLSTFEEAYNMTDPYVVGGRYVLEAGLLGPGVSLYALRTGRPLKSLIDAHAKMKEAEKAAKTPEEKKAAADEYAALVEKVKAAVAEERANYDKENLVAMDLDLMDALWTMFTNDVSPEQWPAFFNLVSNKYKGSFRVFGEKMFASSMLFNEKAMAKYLAKPTEKAYNEDLALMVADQVYAAYLKGANPAADEKLKKSYRLFVKGLREMQPERVFYPDANSTMRLTYGEVAGYNPADGVTYHHFTTLDGLMAKEDPSNFEFEVPARLKQLWEAKDYGQYADASGQLVVNFIHKTDITGGNSGSPVINAKGHLIGTAFDGNWEAMSGDIYFQEQYKRTISCDIRYTLFIIDKYAGARHLIDEMTVIGGKGK